MLGTRKPAPKSNQPTVTSSLDSLFVESNRSAAASSSSSSSQQQAPVTVHVPAPIVTTSPTSSSSSPALPAPATHEEEEFAMHVYELMNMGFSSEHATIALKRCSNKLPDAITFCLDHDDDTMRQFIEEERTLTAIRQRNAAAAARPSPSAVQPSPSSAAVTTKPESKSMFKRMIGLKGKERRNVSVVSASPTNVPMIIPATTGDTDAPPSVNPNYVDPALANEDFLLMNNRSLRLDETPSAGNPASSATNGSSSGSSSSSSTSVAATSSVLMSAPPPPTHAVSSSAARPPAVVTSSTVSASSSSTTHTIYPAAPSASLQAANPYAASNVSSVPSAGAAVPPPRPAKPAMLNSPSSAPIDPYAAAMAKIHQIRQNDPVLAASSSLSSSSAAPATTADSTTAPVDNSPFALAMAKVQQARQAEQVKPAISPVVTPGGEPSTSALGRSRNNSNAPSPASVPTPAPAAVPAVFESSSSVMLLPSPSPIRDSEPRPFSVSLTSSKSEVTTEVPVVAAPPVTAVPALRRSESPVIVASSTVSASSPVKPPQPPPPPRRESVTAPKEVEPEPLTEILVDLPPTTLPATGVVVVDTPSSAAESDELSEFGYAETYTLNPTTPSAASSSRPPVNSVRSMISVESAVDETAIPVSVTSAKVEQQPIVAITNFLTTMVSGVVANSESDKNDGLLQTLKSKSSEVFEQLGAMTSTSTDVESKNENGSITESEAPSLVVTDESPFSPSAAGGSETLEVVKEPVEQIEAPKPALEEPVIMSRASSSLVEPSVTMVTTASAGTLADMDTSTVNTADSREYAADDDTTNEEEAEERDQTYYEQLNQELDGVEVEDSSTLVTEGIASVRAEAALISSNASTPVASRRLPSGAVPTAFVAHSNSMSQEAETSARSSESRSSDDNDEDDHTAQTGSLEQDLQYLNEMRFESESIDSFTSSNLAQYNATFAATTAAAVNASLTTNLPINRAESGSRRLTGGVAPPTMTSSPTRSPTVSVNLTGTAPVASAPAAPAPVVHTELYRLSRNFASHVKKRRFLEFHVTPQDGNKYKATISLKQVKLGKNENSPQGARANSVTIGVCSTRELANDLCLSLAPPEWTGKKDSTSCSACNVQFTMFTKKGHHCRNCGYIVCTNCSNKNWPSSMIPSTYHDSEKYVRVCKTCQIGTEMFIRALREGDYPAAVLLYDFANINLHYPFGIYVNNAYPVHCAAVGGNLELLKWLIDVKKCSIFEKATRKPLVYGRNNLSVLAVAAQAGHVDIMRYLVREKKCNVLEITEISIMHRALHMALEAPGPMPEYVPPKRRDNEEVLVSNNNSPSAPSNQSLPVVAGSGSTNSSPSSAQQNTSNVPSPAARPPQAAANRRTTMDNSTLVANSAAHLRSSSDDSVMRGSTAAYPSAPVVPATYASSSTASSATTAGIATRGMPARDASNTSQMSIMESNVQAYYDQAPVHLAAEAEVVVGQVFTGDASAADGDAPVAASAFLADDVVFAVADVGSQPTRQVSERYVAVANPYVPGATPAQPTPAPAARNGPLPELIVESSVGRQSNNGRWW